MEIHAMPQTHQTIVSESRSKLQTLLVSAENELREARRSTCDGLYAILCALGVMKLKNEINRSRYPEWRKSA